MSSVAPGFDWNNPTNEPLSNGPIRVVTGPVQARFALDSDRWEMEYLLPFPFHAVDPVALAAPPLQVEWHSGDRPSACADVWASSGHRAKRE